MSMPIGLRVRFSVMMFLQYAVWGAWTPVAYPFFKEFGFSSYQVSWLFSALWIACIVAPFIGGQIVDRWFPTQVFLGAAHLAGGVFLILIARSAEFGPMMKYMMIYSLLYAPTLALTNSICFHHLKDIEKDFGSLRAFGTMGWIVAGFVLTGWRLSSEAPLTGDLFYLSGGLSILLGLFCFSLPHTPPKKEAENPYAFIEAFKLLKDKNFLIFFLICFVVTTELQFYYVPTAGFLQAIGLDSKLVPMTMTTAQIAEFVIMAFFLGVCLKKFGVRTALAIGVIAWPVRYLFFALGQPLWLVVASLTLHGLGYTFFFVVSQIYVDNVAPKDIRASAQALLAFATLGVGNFLGTQFYGFIESVFSKKEIVDGVEQTIVNWTGLFLVPCALTVACAVAFLLFFKPEASQLRQPGGAEEA